MKLYIYVLFTHLSKVIYKGKQLLVESAISNGTLYLVLQVKLL